MKLEDLNKKLRELAVAHKMCETVAAEWNTVWKKDKLIQVFLKNLDFYFDTRFITTDIMVSEFGHTMLRSVGISADDEYSFLNPKRTLVLGRSNSKVRINARNVSEVYVADVSYADIIVKGNAFVLIHAYDKANIRVTAKDNANATVLRHSVYAQIITEGSVKVRSSLNP